MQLRAVPGLVPAARKPATAVWIALGSLTVLATVLRAFHLSFPQFWNDEYATYMFATEPLSRVLGAEYRVETNPPLYYLLQRLWLGLGDSRAAMRTLPMLCGVLTIPLTFVLGRRLVGTGASLVGAALVATSQIHVHHGREVRCYTLLTAACVGAIACLVNILARRAVLPALHELDELDELDASDPTAQASKRSELALWLGHASLTLLALYTHSTGILLVALNGVLFCGLLVTGRLDRTLIIRWLWVQVCIGLLYVPRLLVLVHQARDVLPDFWVPASTPGWVYAQILGAYPFPKWSKPLFLVLFAYGSWSMRKRPVSLALALVFIVGQPLLLYIASLFRHVFLVRALVWPTVLGFLIVGQGVWALGARLGTRAVAVATVVLCALQATTLRADLPERPRPAPAAAFVAPLRAFNSHTDRLVFAPLELAWALWYEGRALGLPRRGLGVTFGDHPLQLEHWYGADHVKRAELTNSLGATRRVWFVLERKPKFAPAAGDGFETVLAALEHWGSVTQRWQSGPLELLSIERGPTAPDATFDAQGHATTSDLTVRPQSTALSAQHAEL